MSQLWPVEPEALRGRTGGGLLALVTVAEARSGDLENRP
jgi:hypothetical protein